MKKILAFLFALTLTPNVVSAQTVCGTRDKFLDHLSQSYGEIPTATGITSNGKLIEILTSRKGTFTIIVVMPDGKACLLAAGEAWQNLSPEELERKHIELDDGA